MLWSPLSLKVRTTRRRAFVSGLEKLRLRMGQTTRNIGAEPLANRIFLAASATAMKQCALKSLGQRAHIVQPDTRLVEHVLWRTVYRSLGVKKDAEHGLLMSEDVLL